MTNKKSPTDKFFKNSNLTLEKATEIVTAGLEGADYGELYQEVTERETLRKDKGEYTISVGNGSSGFGFRVGQGARVGYSFADIFNEESLKAAVKQSRQVLKSETSPVQTKAAFGKISKEMYPEINPMENMSLQEKIAEIDKIEAYAKSLDARIKNVTVFYQSAVKKVHIITADGQSLTDTRPMTSLSISLTVEDEDGKVETGRKLLGGHVDCKDVFTKASYEEATREALHQAKELLIAEDAPAGVMDVVLGAGWPSVIIHEAVGHGLEGDFNRKDISVYSGKIGEKVAADGVTIVDQGDIPGSRGSLHFDDEGTPTQENVLIEDGVLKKYMQDRQNAQLMGVDPTGNGRRQSYKHTPMVRMTNTYVRNGEHDPKDIIKSVKDGLYVPDMSGGQVNITSGKFNMNAVLAYRIRDGKLCEPIKGATIVGDGLTVIQSIVMVGNDMAIDNAAGMCGKNGQMVPVGNGQPTIRVKNMTIGGMKK